jgi:spermidine synthase
VEEIVICEIDEEVINASKKYLPTMQSGYNDPRITVHVYDGAKFLEEHQNEYDVIITNSSDPVGPGVVLFETPFYQAMYNALRDGGIVCLQGENVWLHINIIKPLVQSIHKIYTTVELAYASVPTYPSGQLGYIVATKNRPTCKVPTRQLTDTTVQKQMKYYSTEMHAAVFIMM